MDKKIKRKEILFYRFLFNFLEKLIQVSLEINEMGFKKKTRKNKLFKHFHRLFSILFIMR